MIDVFLTMYSNLYHFTHLKRRLTQIFAKNKKVLKHGAAF